MDDEIDLQLLRRTTHSMGNVLQSLMSSTEQLIDLLAPSGDAKTVRELPRIADRSRAQMQELRLLIGAVWDVIAWSEHAIVYQPAVIRITSLTRQLISLVGGHDQVISFALHTPEIQVWADPVRISWILHRLLRDAIRRAQAHPHQPQVRVQVRRVRAHVCISVQDNGTLLNPTDQVEEGLRLCRALIAQGGGTIMTHTQRTGTRIVLQLAPHENPEL